MATIQLPADFKEFLQLLNEHDVEYLLIGGYAVGYYGYPRATVDMDIWIAINPANAAQVVATLQQAGVTKTSTTWNISRRTLILHVLGNSLYQIAQSWQTRPVLISYCNAFTAHV
jgi:hypothetical protein